MSKQRDKGTRLETLMTRWLRGRLGDDRIDRMPLKGNGDEGDISGIRTILGEKVAVEVKAHATYNLAGWIAEAEVERGNADAHAAVVIFKRRGKAQPRDQFVLMDAESFAVLLGADREWET